MFFSEYKMVIRSAKSHHQGLYQCFAESQAGVQYATMRVDVNNNKMDTGGLQSCFIPSCIYLLIGLDELFKQKKMLIFS